MINTIDTVDAGTNARGAVINARICNDMNRARFTAAERAKAETFADILREAYINEVRINFRKTMITLKVMGNNVRDKWAVSQVLAICKERGYKVRASEQGINFNLQKV